MLGALVTIMVYRPHPVSISIDGNMLEPRKLSIIAVANGRYFAGGMCIAPHADCSDGLFDIAVMTNAGRLDYLVSLPRVYRGTHLNHPKLSMYRGGTVTVSTPGRVALEADGEFLGYLPAEFSLIPAGIHVIR